ncbi:MAG: hypothetical protein CMI00_05955 [Oceanospirillaceae bacterium]|nr:hypothetical protein [Oceanospirillaceae bacterium]|tara:strand:+ start:2686 stop:4131 length:1446 start_codon:yes stop_codon:yes gene_type:complete
MIILPVERRLDWKHAPVTLISIILLNILIFFLYQANDPQKFDAALGEYLSAGMLEKEWPVYKDYLRAGDRQAELESLAHWYVQKNYRVVAANILENRRFYTYLEENGRDLFYQSYYSEWSELRPVIQQQVNDMSFYRFGLTADNLSVVDLIAHQFLHGDFMHLLGNMMFLMLCGFVVEAAIGHLPFLGFYLLGGVVAGLTQAAMDMTSDQPMIGASGSVSAVMAMYVVLYRMQSIRFFYWFYLIVGYFRAPALVILPVWVGLELLKLWHDPQSNVAFMAHVGGFVAGGVLIGLLAAFRPGILNTEYLESPQDDGEAARQQMSDIYNALEKYRFEQAYRLIQQALKDQGPRFELLFLRHNLLKIRKGDAWKKNLNLLLRQTHLSDEDIRLQEGVWKEVAATPELVGNPALLAAAQNFTQLDNLVSAEQIFALLKNRHAGAAKLGVLANQLSAAGKRLNYTDTSEQYAALARQLMHQQMGAAG